MDKIAIDVIVLPPRNVQNRTVEISKNLFKETGNDAILLDKEKCIPHVTLVMMCVDEDDLPKIKKIVEGVALQTKPLNLKFIKIESGPTPDGGRVSGLKIERTPEILGLHEELVRKTNPYRKKEAKIESLYQYPKPTQATVTWINKFGEHSSFEKYNPHLTIGFGTLKNIEMPPDFTANKIAICQLGNYCTCRKMLVEIDLKD